MNRTHIIVIGGVLAVILLLVGVWFFFFRGDGGLVTDGSPIGGIAEDAPGSARDILPDGTEFAQGAGTDISPRLVRITEGPVAFGSVAVIVPAATTTVTAVGDDGATATTSIALPPDVEVRFVERQSGNIYAYRAHARTLTRLTNQTVPGVIEAWWLADGSRAFLRFFSNDAEERLETYALPVTGEGGYFLEQDLAQVVTSGASVFSLLTSTTGSTGTVARGDGGGARTIFTSPLSSLRIAFADSDFVATTKASASVDGYGFYVSGTTGSFSRVVGPLRGLTTLPDPTGTTLLYSYRAPSGFSMALMDITTRESLPLPLATIASKCVWNGDGSAVYCAVPASFPGTLPDDWYQGAVSFSDRIWRIDAVARVATLLIDPSTVSGIAVDAVSLATDPSEDFLVFTNRSDGSLWAYDL